MFLKCEKCGAMYIISDEKLKSQDWKFKCNKCQHETIVKHSEQTTQTEVKVFSEELLPPEIQKYLEQFTTDPKSKGFLPVAEYYFKKSNFEKTIEILDAGLKHHAGYISAHILRGRTLFNLGRFEEAARELEEVCNKSKENTLARKTLAKSYESLGAYDKAEQELEIVLMLDPKDEEAKQILEELRKKRPEITTEEKLTQEKLDTKIEETEQLKGTDTSKDGLKVSGIEARTTSEEDLFSEKVIEDEKTEEHQLDVSPSNVEDSGQEKDKVDEFADLFSAPAETEEKEITTDETEISQEIKDESRLSEPSEGFDESLFQEPATSEDGLKVSGTEVQDTSEEGLFSEEVVREEKTEEPLQEMTQPEISLSDGTEIFGENDFTTDIEHAEFPEVKADFPAEKGEPFLELDKKERLEEIDKQLIPGREGDGITFDEELPQQISEAQVEGFDTDRFDNGVSEDGVIEDVFKDEPGIEMGGEVETEIKEFPETKQDQGAEEIVPEVDEEVLKAQRPKVEPLRSVAISVSSLGKDTKKRAPVKPIFIILPIVLLLLGAGAGYYYWTFIRVDPVTASVDKLITISKGIIKSGEKSKIEAERFYTEAKLAYDRDSIKGYMEAYEKLKNAIVLDPHNPGYFALMADVSAELGVYKDKKYLEESNKLSIRAQVMSPGSNDSVRALGHYYKTAGRKQEAIEYLNKALSIKNDDIYASLLLADILSDDLSGIDKAEELVNRVLTVREIPPAFYILGKIYEQKGALDKAIEFYKKNLNENHVKSIIRLLRVLGKNNSYEEAEKIIGDITTKTSEFSPEEKKEILLTIANLQMNYGKLPEAKQNLEEVVKLSPGEIRTYELLGSISSKERRLEEAAGYYEKALQLEPENPEDNYMCGRIYIQLHKYTQAINKLKLSVKNKPNEYEYRKELGHAYVLNGEIDNGIQELEEALKISPKGVEALYNLINAYLMKEMTDKALELAQRSVASDPYSVNARVALSKVYFKLNKVKEAKTELEKIINLNIEDAEPYKLFAYILLTERNFKEAEVYAEKAIKVLDDADARSIYAHVLFGRNRYDEAIASLLKAIEFEPYNHKHYYDLGEVYFKKKDYENALKSFQNAISNNPSDVMSNYMMGVVLESMGKVDDAYAQYEKIVTKIDNKFAPAFFRMGIIAEGKGNNTKAVSLFQDAVTIDGSNAEYLYHLGKSFYNIGDAVKAKESLEKAVEISPDNSDIHFQLGIAYDYLGESNRALKEFDQAYKLNSSNVESLVHIANIYRMQGEYDKAMQLLLSAMKKSPELPTIYYSLGMLYEERGELEKAISSYNNAVKIAPKYPDPYYNLGFIYFKLGRNNEAKTSFKKTLDLGIDTERAKKVKSTLSQIP